MGYKIAVVGATGNVGQEMMKILAERDFPADAVVALASEASAGKEVAYGEDQTVTAQVLGDFDFKGTDIVFSSPGARVSAAFSPKAAAAGAVVIDNTSHFRMDPDVPLVVPEVNPQALKDFGGKNIVANPNCSTIQMVVAMKPVHEAFGIRRCVVSTYQSVSGAGRAGMDELFGQTRAVYANDPLERRRFTKQIAFNVIPQIDVFMDNGATREEWKLAAETGKILDPKIKVHATCVRVPVFIGHAEAVNLELEREAGADEIRGILRKAEGCIVVDHRVDEGYVTPGECAGEDAVYISRVREDSTIDNGISMWVVADNLRKGAALNTVQIAERMIADGLI